MAHYRMRQREPDPAPLDPEEIASIVGTAVLDLINSPAEQPRVTWIGHATSLVQYRAPYRHPRSRVAHLAAWSDVSAHNAPSFYDLTTLSSNLAANC